MVTIHRFMETTLRMTVLIPTYRRPNDLKCCLESLRRQKRLADEILITVRGIDSETWAFLKTFAPDGLPLRVLNVEVPGVIAAINLGFESAQGDIISVTDDDAAPHPDWLERIETHFLADDRLGGLGGRDYLHINGILQESVAQQARSRVVGRLQWFGRMIGNHHLGDGVAREVDILKGVNMSFRREALAHIRCDERLKGTGAQVHFEVALSLAVKQQGWKLLYDPAVAVDHYQSQRFDEDQRYTFNAVACQNIAHNETFILLSYLPLIRRLVYIVWALLVGIRGTPGLVQVLRFLPSERTSVLQRWVASMQGRWQGWQTWQNHPKNYLKMPVNDSARGSL